jgi:NAD-dependent dihydropyrimidine dehydrogenase PreA subunit
MYNPIYLKDVVSLKLDPDKCIGCGMCTEVCPHDVFALNAKKAEIISKDACMECGACQMNCPTTAIGVDVGVGCTAAVINTALGIQTNSCCCVIESPDSKTACTKTSKKTGCC